MMTESRTLSSSIARSTVILACITVLLIVATEVVLSAIRTGTCCFDDAGYAVVSKNLAQGRGYLSSLDYANFDHRGTLFHPRLGNGPSTIMVGALAIWIFGPRPAVPALSLIIVNGLIFAGWIYLLGRRSSRTRALVYAAVFTFSSVVLTAKHHEQWFAFMGEFEAFLLAAAAFALASFGTSRPRTFFCAGVLLGFSFLAKELSMLYALAFGLAAVVQGIFSIVEPGGDPSRFRILFRNLCLAAAGTLTPILLFESYHLHALGISGWIENWRLHLAFVRSQGLAQAVGASVIDARSLTLRDRYFLGLVPLAVITTIMSALIWRYCRDRKTRAYGLFMFAAFAIHLGYWVFMSIGWARYVFNAILFACAIVPILILGAKASPAKWTAALTIISTTFAGWAGLAYYSSAWLGPAWLWSRDDAQIQLNVVKYLDEERRSGAVYAPWWAHISSLEYLEKEPGRFSSITAQSNAPGLLVINRRLPLPDSPEYATLAARCVPLRTFEPDYEIRTCTAGAGWKPQN